MKIREVKEKVNAGRKAAEQLKNIEELTRVAKKAGYSLFMQKLRVKKLLTPDLFHAPNTASRTA